MTEAQATPPAIISALHRMLACVSGVGPVCSRGLLGGIVAGRGGGSLLLLLPGVRCCLRAGLSASQRWSWMVASGMGLADLLADLRP